MDKETLNSIINIVNATLPSNLLLDIQNINYDLETIGIDSLSFIQIIVAIEDEFECEIPYSKIIVNELNTIKKIYSIISALKNGENIE